MQKIIALDARVLLDGNATREMCPRAVGEHHALRSCTCIHGSAAPTTAVPSNINNKKKKLRNADEDPSTAASTAVDHEQQLVQNGGSYPHVAGEYPAGLC